MGIYQRIIISSITRKLSHLKRITYKNQREYVNFIPRIGICKLCGKSVSKGEIPFTHLHHIKYHDDNHLKDVIEICLPCHISIENERRRILRDQKICYGCNIPIKAKRIVMNPPTDLVLCRRCGYGILGTENHNPNSRFKREKFCYGCGVSIFNKRRFPNPPTNLILCRSCFEKYVYNEKLKQQKHQQYLKYKRRNPTLPYVIIHSRKSGKFICKIQAEV